MVTTPAVSPRRRLSRRSRSRRPSPPRDELHDESKRAAANEAKAAAVAASDFGSKKKKTFAPKAKKGPKGKNRREERALAGGLSDRRN
jgi:hypothetical protein